jgi:hypothetical protein
MPRRERSSRTDSNRRTRWTANRRLFFPSIHPSLASLRRRLRAEMTLLTGTPDPVSATRRRPPRTCWHQG